MEMYYTCDGCGLIFHDSEVACLDNEAIYCLEDCLYADYEDEAEVEECPEGCEDGCEACEAVELDEE